VERSAAIRTLKAEEKRLAEEKRKAEDVSKSLLSDHG